MHQSDLYSASTAVVVSRTTPGPIGVYVVSVEYYADGIAGAAAGWLAIITPALFIILLLRLFGRAVDHPRFVSLQQAVVFASAGLLVAASVPLAQDAATGVVTAVIIAGSVLLMVFRKADALWDSSWRGCHDACSDDTSRSQSLIFLYNSC